MQDSSWQNFTRIHDGVREYLRKHNSIVVAAQYILDKHYIVYYNNDYDLSTNGSYEKELNGEKFHFLHLSSFLYSLANCNFVTTEIALTCQFAMNGFDAIIKKYLDTIKECQTQAGKVRGVFRSIEFILINEIDNTVASNKAALIHAFNAVRVLQSAYQIDQQELYAFFDKQVDQFFTKTFDQYSEDELKTFRAILLKQIQEALLRLTREEIRERLDITYGSMVEEIAKINHKLQLGD